MKESAILNGDVVEWDDGYHEDGTVQICPRQDTFGRSAVTGTYENYGYSGYFRFYIFVDGKRRRLTNGWMLFPNNEHHYNTQRDKAEVMTHIVKTIEKHKGMMVNQITQGWEIQGIA